MTNPRTPSPRFDYSIIRLFDYFSHSIIQFNQGFTLIELLVVIAIIGILSAVLISSFGSGTASARSAQCLSNMRNLAAGCQTYGADHRRYPLAGSIEYMTISESRSIRNAQAVYHECPGWISWNSRGAYRNAPKSHMASSSWITSLYSTDEEANTYCLTNGALWRYVSANRTTYVCPAHATRKKQTPPQWSYLMNAYFGWDASEGSDTQSENFDHIEYGRLKRADRVLLFSEIQFENYGAEVPDGNGTACDCVLQYSKSAADSNADHGANNDTSGNESIGANHVVGRDLFAHVAFADGHVEKLRIPYTGSAKNPKADATQLRNLTSWLCTGEDVSFDGKQYKRMDN